MKKISKARLTLLPRRSSKTILTMKFLILLILTSAVNVSASSYLQNTQLNLVTQNQSLRNVSVLTPSSIKQLIVTGKVTDSQTGDPLPGVNIILKGTTQGTISQPSGEYSIEVADASAILVFSFIGYDSQEAPVGGKTIINVALTPEAISLDEVVAIGYGTQKRATITGSVASVSGADLQQAPTTNLSSTLAGRMTGVIVNTRGSSPGDEAVEINIRGKSSWMGGGPLIIIDGIANRSGFEKIDPNDIESVSVLKDASAAIYGSRAANGVILITTKRGKSGKPTIEYSGDFGITSPTRVPDMTRSWQFATYFTEAKRNGYMWSDAEIEKFRAGTDANLYPNYNLQDYVLQNTAAQTTHALSLRGGNESVKYYVSGRYLYEDSFFKGGIDNFNAYNVRTNVDAQVTKNFSVSFDLSGRRDDIRRAVGGGTVGNVDVGFFEDYMATDPTKPIFYKNGLPASIFDHNVVESIKGKAGERNSRNLTINTKTTARWDLPFITEGLYVEGTAAYDFSNVRTKQFSKSYDVYSFDNSTGNYSNLNTTPILSRGLYDYFYNSYRYNLNSKLGYQKTFNDHTINTFIAYEQYSINTEWIQATRSSFLSDEIPFAFAGDANTQKNDGSGSEFAYKNYFGRLSYDFKEKYLLDFTLRRDESLKFPANNRVGWFPGISAGWRLSEESFIKDNFDNINSLKLRASFGQMGSDNVGDFQYLASAALYGTSDSYVLGTNPSVVPTLHFTGTPNPNITWGVANTYNVGIEGAMYNHHLGFEAEYFFSNRNNILTARNASVPFYAGMTLPLENIGKSQNQGIELMVFHRNTMGDFSYYISGNFTYTANKIIYMDESPNVPDYQKKEGHPIDSWLLYRTDGIINTQAELDATSPKRAGAQVGDIKYLNMNDDNVVDDLDRFRVYKSSLPKIIYGLNINLQYKGISLNMLWQGQAKAWTYINPTTRNGDINVPLWMYDDRWTPTNENATMPRAFYHRSDTYNTVPSEFWLQNAAFLRLKSLELGYTIPKNIVSKVSFNSAKVYISGFNLLLFDKLKNYDPEVVNEQGIFYPATKVFNVGVKLSF